MKRVHSREEEARRRMKRGRQNSLFEGWRTKAWISSWKTSARYGNDADERGRRVVMKEGGGGSESDG